ncbi:hypothetical protein GTP55_13525 [Duganella sp. FT109W]|uniref:Plasmid mobilization relaxosome protein MobC n=1 Tax=Duganella margarita TaxID=2692170 RepID=A0ABW9WGX7_9BURK|nr:hypothetical protein [Duganella margarita]MYN40394.1 hypothetical protein [Duganella margarita]
MATRPNRINIDLGPYKGAWLAYCKANGVTSNQAFRQIVAKLTAKDEGVPQREQASAQEPKSRKILRLTAAESDYVSACARLQGFSDNRWIVALIRARMESAPQLGAAEIEMLGRSNLILLGMARQLNRLATTTSISSAANSSELVTTLRALHHQFTGHVEAISSLLASNLARWGRG